MNTEKKCGTLGLYLSIGEKFTVGDVRFTVTEIRNKYTQDGNFFTSLLSYSPAIKENAAIVLYQHKELVFYHDITFKMWLGKQTTHNRAHVFICADKSIIINRVK